MSIAEAEKTTTMLSVRKALLVGLLLKSQSAFLHLPLELGEAEEIS